MFRSLFLIIRHRVFGKYVAVFVFISAISIIVTGAVNEAPKLRSLCVAHMSKVWETDINTKGPSLSSGSFANAVSNIVVGNPAATGSFHSRSMSITQVPSTLLHSFSLLPIHFHSTSAILGQLLKERLGLGRLR